MSTTALSLATLTGVANAQQYADATVSEPVVVTATRTEEKIDEVPATVTVIDDETIENNLANDIKDLVRFEPGVSVRSSPARFSAALASTGRDGNSGFNIRGLEGDRVLFTVDGVRVPDGFSYGPAAFGRGDYVDLDLLRSVEILRGPASALYGSDGLAGAVSFVTKDPSDYLAEGDNFGARLRASYASASETWSEGASAAARWGDWSALITYTRRDGHEQDNQGELTYPDSRRTAPNPQDIESNAAMAKLVFQPSAHQRFRLTYDYGDRNITTEALSARAVPPYAASSVIDLDGVDESDRQRVTFDHRFENEGGLIDRGFWAVYWQDSHARQFSDEDRYTSVDRTRDTTFDNRVWGAALQLESQFDWGSVQHKLVYGADYSSTRQEGLRNGTVPPTGEFFPVRAFPVTDYDLFGAFVQDQITLLDGQLELFPAVRYDHYELNPERDALYPAAVAPQSDEHVSPKFGVVVWPIHSFGVFANYAEGFKAPSPSQVNNYFENLGFGYTSIPNPDLKPETSDSFEVGVRWRDIGALGATWRASATAFTAKYRDFISQEVVNGTGAPGDPLQFQYINLNEVDVYGLEGRADAHWDNGLGFTAAASWTNGEQTTLGARSPLQSIDPWKLVIGLTYADPGGRFGGQLIATYSARKDDSDVAENQPGNTAADLFTPDSFTILDATAYWNVTDYATLRIGAFNLTDEKYWWWGDVRGVAASSTIVDAYTQPGRNFSASLALRF